MTDFENEGLVITAQDSLDVNQPTIHSNKKSPIDRVQSVLQATRDKLPQLKKSLKIATATSLAFLADGSVAPYIGEPYMDLQVPGAAIVRPVTVWEENLATHSDCWQVTNGELQLVPNTLPNQQPQLTCQDSEAISAMGPNSESIERVEDIDNAEILLDALYDEIKPIQDLAPSDKKPDVIVNFFHNNFKRGEKSSDYDAYSTYNMGWPQAEAKKGEVDLFFNDETILSDSLLKMIASHEAFHVADAASNSGDIFWSQHDELFVEMFDSMSMKAQRDSAARIEHLSNTPDSIIGKYKADDLFSSLFEFVSEGSYFAGGAGHPQDNPKELFASTATVLRYFPSSFMTSINKLDPADQQFMKMLAGHTVKFFNGTSHEIDHKRLQRLFDPELLEWLFGK